MPERMMLDTALLIKDGLLCGLGELTGGAQDGFDFVFFSDAANPSEPLLMLSPSHALLAIRNIAAALQSVKFNAGFNDLIQSKIETIIESVDAVIAACED